MLHQHCTKIIITLSLQIIRVKSKFSRSYRVQPPLFLKNKHEEPLKRYGQHKIRSLSLYPQFRVRETTPIFHKNSVEEKEKEKQEESMIPLSPKFKTIYPATITIPEFSPVKSRNKETPSLFGTSIASA